MSQSQSKFQEPGNSESNQTTRRGFLASLIMGVGVALSYGALALEGLLFILPRGGRARTRITLPLPKPRITSLLTAACQAKEAQAA